MKITQTIRVVFIDDDEEMLEIVRDILNLTADIQLVGTGHSGWDAVTLCERLQPDVLLLDVLMPVMDGVETANVLRQKFPRLKILAVSSTEDEEHVYAMLQNGADGYISKSKLFHDLAEAIRAIFRDDKILSDTALKHLLKNPVKKRVKKDFGLTQREMQILQLMGKGLSRSKIAATLGISESTAKFHILNICTKLGSNTQSLALVTAIRNGLI